MVWFRSCPKCQGDLFLTQEMDGYAVSCLQCSRALRPDEEARLGLHLTSERAMAAVGREKAGRHYQRHVA